jgi:hypothetical protein
MKIRITVAFCSILSFTVCASVLAQEAGTAPASAPTALPAPAEVQARVATIESVPQLLQLARRFENEKAWASAAIVWRRLTTLSPHNPNYLYSLTVNYALADDKSQAYNALLAIQQAGVGFDLTGEPRFANLHGTEVWDYLVKLHDSARNDSFGEGAVAFEIAPGDRLLESIAWDPVGKSFLLGSARDGVIYRSDRNGRLTAWANPEGESWWSIFDIKVDAARKFVWVTTAAIPHFKGYAAEMAGRASLLKLDLESGKLLAAYPAPNDRLPHILNSIAVSSKGFVVVGEGLRGQLFKLENDALVPLMAEPKLNSIRGMVFSPDDRILYFTDYERGLFGLEIARSTAFDLEAPGDAMLYSIEGLYMYEGQLVAIQNGFSPNRVARFKLSEDGHKIEQTVPVEANNPAFATPTIGTLVGNDLYYIANSQRSYYDSYGLLKGGKPLPPVKVFKTNVRHNWEFRRPSLPASVGPGPIRKPAGD